MPTQNYSLKKCFLFLISYRSIIQYSNTVLQWADLVAIKAHRPLPRSEHIQNETVFKNIDVLYTSNLPT